MNDKSFKIVLPPKSSRFCPTFCVVSFWTDCQTVLNDRRKNNVETNSNFVCPIQHEQIILIGLNRIKWDQTCDPIFPNPPPLVFDYYTLNVSSFRWHLQKSYISDQERQRLPCCASITISRRAFCKAKSGY